MTIGSSTPKRVDMELGKNHSAGSYRSGSARSILSRVSSHSIRSSAGSSVDLSELSPFSARSADPYIDSADLKAVLAEKVKQRYHDIIKALKNFDRHETGKVIPFHLKNVLRIFCYPFNSESFDDLIQEVPRDKRGLISYKEFLRKLASDNGPLLIEDQKSVSESISSDMSETNIEQLELKLKCKIGDNLKNVVRSMWLYDYNQDGFIQRKELRTILENYCCKMTDNQFKWLWNRYGDHGNLVSYKHFLMKLGINVETFQRFMTRDAITKALCWVDHPFGFAPSEARKEIVERRYAREQRDDPSVQGRRLEDIVKMFQQKVERNAALLFSAFMMMDSAHSGYLHISVLHRTLNFFVMPMSPALFMQLAKSLGIVFPASKKVCWYEFLKAIACGNSFTVKKDTLFPKSRSPVPHSCSFIVDQIKKQGKHPHDFFKKAFTRYDQNKKLMITRSEFKRVLDHTLIPPPTDQQFRDLMMTLDPGHTNMIDCEKFFSLLESLSKEMPIDEQNKNSGSLLGDLHKKRTSFSNLHNEKLQKKMKKYVDKNFRNIEKALFTLDTEETGYIQQSSLKNVLDNFCFPLSDMQFEEIILPVKSANDLLNYNEFLNFYKKNPKEDEEKWVHAVDQLTSDKKAMPKKFSFEELCVMLRELLCLHKDNLLQEFKSLDAADLGIASREDFMDLLRKYTFRMDPEQFNLLWSQLPKNDFGYLKYNDFLQEWAKTETKQPSRRPLPRTVSADNPVNAADCSICLSPSSQLETERSSHSQKRPKTASCVLSFNREASKTAMRNNGFTNRPRSAASSFASSSTLNSMRKKMSVNPYLLTNLDTSQGVHANMVVEGKAVENSNCAKMSKKAPRENHEVKNQDEAMNTGFKQKENEQDNVPNYNDMKALSSAISAEKYLCSAISERWRDMLRRCKSADGSKDGIISCDKLLDILKNTGVDMSDEVQKLLANKYNICRGTAVNYWDFFHKFILLIGSQDDKNGKNVMYRRCLPRERANIVLGEESPELYRVLLTLRDKVVKNRKILWQKFCKADPKSIGLIDFSDFHKILNQMKVKLSENDVFYLKDYYDVNLTGKISYVKFLRTFIKP